MAQNPQRRLLTDSRSKLGGVDLITILRKEAAWISLPREVRQDLCNLLPDPRAGEPAQEPDLNPLSGHCRGFIEAELRRWQDDLQEGKETRKWREEAMEAGKDRLQGCFDETIELGKQQRWGKATATITAANLNSCEANGVEAHK